VHSRRLFSDSTRHERHDQVDVDDDKFLLHYGFVNDGFPSWLSTSDRRRLLQSSEEDDGVLADNVVTVAQDGSGNYTTITDALNAAPNKSLERYVIHVTEGIYQEYIEVPKYKTNIMLMGDGINATVITGNRSVVDGWTTYRSATVAKLLYSFLCLCF
jgi:pectinesterase